MAKNDGLHSEVEPPHGKSGTRPPVYNMTKFVGPVSRHALDFCRVIRSCRDKPPVYDNTVGLSVKTSPSEAIQRVNSFSYCSLVQSSTKLKLYCALCFRNIFMFRVIFGFETNFD